MKKTAKMLMAGVASVLLTACGGKGFNVTGEITNAKDSVLYFENVGLNGIEEIGTVKLGEDGHFAFSGDAPEAPEFYRLRIGDQIINVAIDSTEHIIVRAQYPQMATQYEISGSDNNQKIKELTLKQIALQEKAIALERNGSISPSEARDSLAKMLFAYKEEVKNDYIFKAPNESYAYFALFQTLGPWLIFDPKTSSEDVKVFAAVATSWDTFHPGALRGENLHNIAIEGMKNVRHIEARNQPQVIEENKVVESGVIDIELTDNKGQKRRLTDLKGQVVLLDFHVFAMDESPARILMLRELYNKYHDKGLEIYQISLDGDAHFWKQQTAALPWVSVRDEDGVYSPRLAIYNVQAVPDYFIIDRGNNLIKRAAQMNSLEEEIKKLL